jgi:predicted AlkP superfamily pyrophosphatase or phosphodiesterase
MILGDRWGINAGEWTWFPDEQQGESLPMLWTRRRLCSILLAALCLTSGLSATANPRVGHVFIISFDGGKPSVMQQSHMPTLMRMRREGAGTWTAWTVVPSITLVDHTSMLTGVEPDKHLIDWNEWKPEKGLVQVPTVFALAKAKGFTTALFAGKEKFKHLNVPGTIDDFAVPEYAAKLVAETAARCILQKKPNLCFIHFADSDGAGHQYGWGSAEQKRAFADEDAALKTVCDAIAQAGIAGDTVMILSADHGGHDKTHGSTSLEDMHIPWIVWGKGVKKGFEIGKRVGTCDTTATALWLLGVPLPESLDGRPVTSAF